MTFSFVGDNIIYNWYRLGGAGSPVTLPHLGYQFSTMATNTVTLDLDPGSTCQFVWHTSNYDDSVYWPINPGGFLAEVTSPGVAGSYLSSPAWSVAYVPNDLSVPANFDAPTWVAATSWARNGDPSDWQNVHHGPVPGISLDAQWIWTAANFDDPGAPIGSDSVFIRGTIAIADDCPEFPRGCASVPDPGSSLLLPGISLVRLRAWGRRLG